MTETPADGQLTSRQKAARLTQRVAELEADKARALQEALQWSMLHAHAATKILRARDLANADDIDRAALLSVLAEDDIEAGIHRYEGEVVKKLVTEWTKRPMSTAVTRSSVRDWLLAHLRVSS